MADGFSLPIYLVHSVFVVLYFFLPEVLNRTGRRSVCGWSVHPLLLEFQTFAGA